MSPACWHLDSHDMYCHTHNALLPHAMLYKLQKGHGPWIAPHVQEGETSALTAILMIISNHLCAVMQS